FREDTFDFFHGLEVIVGENARACGKRAKANDAATVYQVLIREHVVRAGLDVQTGRHAVGKIGEESPVLRVQNASPDFRPMRVRINEAGSDRFSTDVKNLRASRSAASGAHTLDAIVFDDDVCVFQDFIAFHRDDSRAAQNYRSLWGLTGNFEVH